jgi:ATP-dependent Lon protease
VRVMQGMKRGNTATMPLMGRRLERNGLDSSDVSFNDDALLAIVEGHTREAGVRGLERQIGKLLREVATRVDGGKRALPTTIEVDDVRQYLGRPRFHSEVAEWTDTPGIATGLAVTGTGGDVLFIEAASMSGDDGMTLTGQLCEVIKESVQIALSYVRSHAAPLNGQHFHVHVPAGLCHRMACRRASPWSRRLRVCSPGVRCASSWA